MDYDPQIKQVLLDYIEVRYPAINDPNFGTSDGLDEDEVQLAQKAAREGVVASLTNIIITLPEFAIQR